MPADMFVTIPLLIVTGPVGAGKTAVAGEMSRLLEAVGVPHALVDLDALRECYPRAADDPFNTALALRNLAAVWANYWDAGARRLIVAGVIESRAELEGYRAAVPGADIAVVRLRAPVPVLQQRVAARETGSGLRWHLARAAELATQMDRDAVEDILIEAGEATPVELARRILALASWPGGEVV